MSRGVCWQFFVIVTAKEPDFTAILVAMFLGRLALGQRRDVPTNIYDFSTNLSNISLCWRPRM